MVVGRSLFYNRESSQTSNVLQAGLIDQVYIPYQSYPLGKSKKKPTCERQASVGDDRAQHFLSNLEIYSST